MMKKRQNNLISKQAKDLSIYQKLNSKFNFNKPNN